MNASSTPIDRDTLRAENNIAAWLSILPGLGQIYKGHFSAGFFWMLIGMPLAMWVGILLGLATAGLGLLIPILVWAALALDAYFERDVRRRHWLPRPAQDGEDDEFQD
jgi:hypothetical protein